MPEAYRNGLIATTIEAWLYMLLFNGRYNIHNGSAEVEALDSLVHGWVYSLTSSVIGGHKAFKRGLQLQVAWRKSCVLGRKPLTYMP